MSGKTKSKPETFQTLENAMVSEIRQIFMALWLEKLVANSLQTSVVSEVGAVALFEVMFRKIVFADFQRYF